MNVGWNDWLTLFNTADTFLALLILALTAERLAVWYGRLRRWLRLRRAQEGQSAVGAAGSEEAQEDEAER